MMKVIKGIIFDGEFVPEAHAEYFNCEFKNIDFTKIDWRKCTSDGQIPFISCVFDGCCLSWDMTGKLCLENVFEERRDDIGPNERFV